MHSLTNADAELTAKNQDAQRRAWARTLHKWGLAVLVSSLLENSGAFSMLAAQSLYISQPLIEGWFPLSPLAQMLEDPGQIEAFVKLLGEDAR